MYYNEIEVSQNDPADVSSDDPSVHINYETEYDDDRNNVSNSNSCTFHKRALQDSSNGTQDDSYDSDDFESGNINLFGSNFEWSWIFTDIQFNFFYLDEESLEESINKTGNDPSNTNESSGLKNTFKNRCW